MSALDTAVLVDANILFDYNLRDLVIWLKILRLRVCTTEMIIDEAARNVGETLCDPVKGQALSKHVTLAMRDALVEDSQSLIPEIKLSVREDRHVIAGAIKGDCKAIITFNLKDLPQEEVGPYRVAAVHPDDWLCQLLEECPELVIRAVREASRLRKRAPRTPTEIAGTLARADGSGVPEFAAKFKAICSKIDR